MGAIAAVPEAVGALKRNTGPLFVAGSAIALGGGVVVAAAQVPVPLASLLLALLVGAVWLFVEPFLAGGYLGMLDESRAGRTDYGTLQRVGREHYTDLLVARVAVLAARFAFGLAVAGVLLAAFVGLLGVALSADTSADPGAATAAFAGELIPFVLAAVVALAWLVQAVVGLFVQFYAAAIVLDGADVAGGFARSYRTVRENVTSVLGYSAVVWFAGLVVALPVVAAALFGEFVPQLLQPTTVENAATALLVPTGTELLSFLVTAVLLLATRVVTVPLLRAYHVVFYRDLTG